jgi:hypothetical protein
MLTGYEDELCRCDEHLATVSSLVFVEFPQKEREYRNICASEYIYIYIYIYIFL